MKKFLSVLFLCAIFLIGNLSFAETTTNWDSAANQKRVNNIGYVLMTKNKLPSGVSFKVSDSEEVNAYANINKEVYVFKGLLKYVENDDELAAVISHELGHIINAHIQKQSIISALMTTLKSNLTGTKLSTTADVASQLSLLKISRSDEYDADLTGVDLMITAGYNPLAMISVLNKITGKYIDVLQTHPSGDKRPMNVYDYLTYNYPTYAKKSYTTNSYKSFLAWATPTVTARNADAKKLAKFKKTQEKLKQKRIKRLQKMSSSANGWDVSYTILNALGSE